MVQPINGSAGKERKKEKPRSALGRVKSNS